MKMDFIDSLCPPALLYLLYIVVHVGLDLSLGMFFTAAVKVITGVAGVLILDALCSVDLGVVSWVIVATPFIMVALGTSISIGLGMDRMAARLVREGFTPISADDKKNKDIYVTQFKYESGALPLNSDSVY
jgi:hypothetical protein